MDFLGKCVIWMVCFEVMSLCCWLSLDVCLGEFVVIYVNDNWIKIFFVCVYCCSIVSLVVCLFGKEIYFVDKNRFVLVFLKKED